MPATARAFSALRLSFLYTLLLHCLASPNPCARTATLPHTLRLRKLPKGPANTPRHSAVRRAAVARYKGGCRAAVNRYQGERRLWRIKSARDAAVFGRACWRAWLKPAQATQCGWLVVQGCWGGAGLLPRRRGVGSFGGMPAGAPGARGGWLLSQAALHLAHRLCFISMSIKCAPLAPAVSVRYCACLAATSSAASLLPSAVSAGGGRGDRGRVGEQEADELQSGLHQERQRLAGRPDHASPSPTCLPRWCPR